MVARCVPPVRTWAYTGLALVAFAANSVLCRLALGDQAIDASSFTVVRLLSGIAALGLLLAAGARRPAGRAARGSWLSALMLFVYASAFSFAYLWLDTGTGALVLFGAVQLTMIAGSLCAGVRLRPAEWLGVAVAFAGLAYLLLPGVSAPAPLGFVLMSGAGVAWGVYSLRGRGSSSPLGDTAFNFARTAPLVIVLALVALPAVHLSPEGLILAVLSGALASGAGYTIWYLALGGLSATEAAVVQLSVPVIAALGGIVFVSEVLSARLVLATALVLGGILTVVLGRARAPAPG